jgi:HD-GYP domain-containing protein (c-di-GMP phosphodiesterase class II)
MSRLRLKLAGRLSLLFLAAGLVPLGVTLLVLAPRGQDALRTSAKLTHQAELETVRARLESALDDLLADVRWLGALPPPVDVAPDAAHKSMLRFLFDKHPELTIVTLYDGEGAKVVNGQAFDRKLVGPGDLESHEREARRLLGAGPAGLRASEFYPAAFRDEMLVTLTLPFQSAGKDSRLAVEVGLRRVQDLIAQMRIGRRGQAFIVDDRGRLVAHRDFNRVRARENLSEMPVVQQLKENIARAKETGRAMIMVRDFIDPGDDSRDEVGAFAPLARLQWGVVTEEPREDAYGLARATWAHAAGWTLLAIAITLLVAVFFARQITRPMARLVDGTQHLARGDFGVAVPIEGPPEVETLTRVFNEASQKLASYDRENRELLAAVERGYLETLRALVNAIEAKDPYTAGHSQRTAEFSVAIGRAMKLDAALLTEIEYGGLLHDIGKMGIPEQILRKPAVLSADEMTLMRTHPAIGGEMTKGVAFLERIQPMIRNHHERFDGSGYPDGIRGEEIPIGARIVAVADTYDAIVSDRPYSAGRPPIEAMAILEKLAGTTLDADVVAAFGRALKAMGMLDAMPAAPVTLLEDDEDERTGRIEVK